MNQPPAIGRSLSAYPHPAPRPARILRLLLVSLFIISCIALPQSTPLPTLAVQSATPFVPATATDTLAPTLTPPGQPGSEAASPTPPRPTEPLTALPTATLAPMSAFQPPDRRITVLIPPGGRYIIIGDSLSYGSTMSGGDTYDDICNNRWPYAEQLAVETGILSTASLDRGDSMKTPFYIRTLSSGQVETFCKPPAGTPLRSTAVAGSNTDEWLADLVAYPVLIEALEQDENPVVLFLVGADIFAAKIGKPPVDVDRYEQNVGKLLAILAAYHKVIYLARIPHVALGSFIPRDELDSTNLTIDSFNQRLAALVEHNGYLEAESGQWIDFGEQRLNAVRSEPEDGLLLFATTLQAGPRLDELSDTDLGNFYAKDGLHFHAEGYNRIGSAWAEALKAPIRINRADYAPQANE